MKQSYYDAHAKEYAELTVKADMSQAYNRFLVYLPAGAGILDAGCGSGRDSLCFIKKGMLSRCWMLLRGCVSARRNSQAAKRCACRLPTLILQISLTVFGPARPCFTFRKQNWKRFLQSSIVR